MLWFNRSAAFVVVTIMLVVCQTTANAASDSVPINEDLISRSWSDGQWRSGSRSGKISLYIRMSMGQVNADFTIRGTRRGTFHFPAIGVIDGDTLNLRTNVGSITLRLSKDGDGNLVLSGPYEASGETGSYRFTRKHP